MYAAKLIARHEGSFPAVCAYSSRLGILRARHLEVEFSVMLISSWLMNGLLKRSCTAAAKASRSCLSSGSVGMTSS